MLVVCAPSVGRRKVVVKTGWMSASVGNDRRVAAVANRYNAGNDVLQRFLYVAGVDARCRR